MKKISFTVSQIILLVVTFIVLIWSGIHPKDGLTWFLESVPGILGLILLVYFHKRSKVSTLLFALICLHSIILFVGAKYTYAEVPFGFWIQESMGWSRNNYDKLGHFFQGFEPAILAREVLLRKKVLPEGKWVSLFSISLSLAFSAVYEMIEWWVALVSGQAAEAFLGTQGDPWDTQSDMLLALIGATLAILLLAKWHRRQLAEIRG